ncbi:MAG: hypothetical protein IMF01_09560 [Proteobacteria bacterium]|nr:hypothetical protein [Pseudomonadota bacterium]
MIKANRITKQRFYELRKMIWFLPKVSVIHSPVSFDGESWTLTLDNVKCVLLRDFDKYYYQESVNEQ